MREDGTSVVARGVDSADSGTDGVVGVVNEEAGHLSGLTANQSATGLDTALGNTGDEGRSGGDVEVTARVAVQEEEGLGTLDDEIVDVHGDEIDTDGIVDANGVGDLELGADSVNGSD